MEPTGPPVSELYSPSPLTNDGPRGEGRLLKPGLIEDLAMRRV